MDKIRSAALSKQEVLKAATSSLHVKLSDRQKLHKDSMWLAERKIGEKICVCVCACAHACLCVHVWLCMSGSTEQIAAHIRGRDNVREIKCKMECYWKMEITSLCEDTKIECVSICVCVVCRESAMLEITGVHCEQGNQVLTHSSEHTADMCWILNTVLFHCPDLPRTHLWRQKFIFTYLSLAF